MFTVGLLAALGPARRGLAVQPTEALREDNRPKGPTRSEPSGWKTSDLS